MVLKLGRSKELYWIFKYMQDVYKNIEEYDPSNKYNVLIV